MNVGAKDENDPGLYFRWGETEGFSNYDFREDNRLSYAGIGGEQYGLRLWKNDVWIRI